MVVILKISRGVLRYYPEISSNGDRIMSNSPVDLTTTSDVLYATGKTAIALKA